MSADILVRNERGANYFGKELINHQDTKPQNTSKQRRVFVVGTIVAQRPAEHNKSVGCQFIHERCMLVPPRLRPERVAVGRERALDQALVDTFPASDPVSIVLPHSNARVAAAALVKPTAGQHLARPIEAVVQRHEHLVLADVSDDGR